MKRGELWTVTASGYAGKPRPAVIVQNDRFDVTLSIAVCGLTTNETEAPLFRVAIEPSERNGLNSASRVMVDKVTSVPRDRLGKLIGRLDDLDMARVDRAMMMFLGLA